MLVRTFILHLLIIFCSHCLAQKPAGRIDSTSAPVSSPKSGIDTAKKYSPKIATIRSAIIPGWGQITNKKYWKLPIVYGGLGTTTALFFRNLKQYRESRDAYRLASDGNPANDNQIKEPYYTVRNYPDKIKAFRNSVRQNVDYCVLIFIVIWGLNVADAAVDAQLKTFDVSDDLSLHIKPGYSPMAKTSGVSLVLSIGKK